MRKLYRSRDDKILGGVLGGLSEHLAFETSLLRLGFVFAAIFTGGVPLAITYLVAWLIIPLAPPKQEAPSVEVTPPEEATPAEEETPPQEETGE